MMNTTNFEINPIIFSSEYISAHLLPVIQKSSSDDTLMKEPFLDLELIFKVVLKNTESGTTTYKLTKALAESEHLDIAFLKKCAWANAYDTVTCQSMNEIFGMPELDMDMYVLSNERKNWGAGAAFICTLKLKELAEKWHTNEIVILPSSVHELIAIKPDMADNKYINAMIADVNAGYVDEKEQLSDHHYIYHADSDSFTF